MKKIKIKYESHIFQEENIERYYEEVIGELTKTEKEIYISCMLGSLTDKEKTLFIFKEDGVNIKRDNYLLEFDLNKLIECENRTQYGNIMMTTKLKKYLKLDNQFIINYELLIGNESIGSYVVKVSYEEMN